MEFSSKGLELLKSLEGYRAKPYNDSANHATVGYGTPLHYGPVTDADLERYKEGISEPDAAQLLMNHVHITVEPSINTAVRVELQQNQFDALCSFVYNVGVAAFDNSTLLRKLNMQQYDSVPNELARWNRAGGEYSAGLANRREKEIEFWKGIA